MGWDMSSQELITPSVMDSTNFKEFFIKHDAIQNVLSELVVSLQPKYKCNAGCNMCYLKSVWLDDHTLQTKYSTPPLTPDVENSMLQLFDSFSIITTIDDLFSFKRDRPDLYDFYVRNGHRMSSTAMSDVAFIQQYPLVMSEVHFKSIYEISFSDAFLKKNAGKLATDIVSKLSALHARSPIIKLKIIMTLDDDTATAGISQITEWARDNNINVIAYDDITKSRLYTSIDVKSTTVQETTFFPYDELPMQVLGEVVYLQYTDMYLTMVDGSSEQDPPFYNIIEDGLTDMSVFLVKMLNAKMRAYHRYLSNLANSCDNKLRDYYQYVVSSVVVNENFNFIPHIVLPHWTEMYNTLCNQGFVGTIPGVYNPNHQGVVPLFEITSTPKHKLHHIPIKCKLVKSQ